MKKVNVPVVPRLHMPSILLAGRVLMRNGVDPDIIALWLGEEMARGRA